MKPFPDLYARSFFRVFSDMQESVCSDTGVIIRLATTEIPTLSRATSGVKLMKSNSNVVDFAVTEHEEPEEETEGEEGDTNSADADSETPAQEESKSEE